MQKVSPCFTGFILAAVGIVGILAPAARAQSVMGSQAPAAAVAAPDLIPFPDSTTAAVLTLPDAPTPTQATSSQQPPARTADQTADQSTAGQYQEGQQTKRILFIIPNFRAVSVDAKLKPLTKTEKLKLAVSDSFDYSSFILAGMIAGTAQLQNSTPEFHQGAAGYARYYWHSFVDQASGNFFVEAFVPIATHEDPRYYTLGRGGVFKRTFYAVSRLAITRKDNGGLTFNASEIIGNGAAAGVSNFYYPSVDRTWTKTGQKWALQIGIDGIANIAKEFWPDVAHKLFGDEKASGAPPKTDSNPDPTKK